MTGSSPGCHNWGLEGGMGETMGRRLRKTRKERENQTDEGGRGPAAGLAGCKARSGQASVQTAGLTQQLKTPPKKSPAPLNILHLSLSEKRERNRNIYTFRLPICDVNKRETTILLSRLLRKLVKWKRPSGRFPHLLHVSVWEWISLNGFPPVPHRVTDKSREVWNTPVALRLQ